MSVSQTPLNDQSRPLSERIRMLGRRLITPHPVIQELGMFRRTQLLNVITLLLIVAFTLGLMSQPKSVIIFYFLLGLSVISFILGKSKFPITGTIIFSTGFISIAYLSIFLGMATGYVESVLAIVPIALIIASALTTQGVFSVLVIYATIAAVLAPFYSTMPIPKNDIPEAGGIIFFIGSILYGVGIFRANLEKARLEEIKVVNRELQDIKTNLEKRVEERTYKLAEAGLQTQERALRLQIVSEISQEISANIELRPKELLARITRIISERLGFYHVGIFLLDENSEYAVLRAANSLGGQRMLDRHHQLKVGGTGIVGYVSQGGHSRIALDTGSDAVFFNNPDLPDTRSEIALPLKYGSNIIGVLDVQSTLASAFKDEDVNILGTLANQIAIVINNGLVKENPQYALTSKKEYKPANRRQKQDSYSFFPDGSISTALEAKSSTVEKAIASGETEVTARSSKDNLATLAVPVKFREQVIGVIQIQAAEENRKWTEDEIIMVQSIADRAAFALENARLFEETIRRAEQEETIAKVTMQIGASTDFNHILQTTIQELGQALGVSRSFIQLGALNENGNTTGQDTPVNTDN